MELNQPVEDQYGYIYENEAIRATLANYACRGQPCACPIAGKATAQHAGPPALALLQARAPAAG